MSERITTQSTTPAQTTTPATTRTRVTSFTLPYSLSGKTAVVTGAARGIGAAVALGLARRGAQVALVGLEPDELAAATARCAWYAPARAWTADVTDRERMQEVAGEIAGYFGRVDIVVANAGIAIGGLFADSDPVAFDRVIEVNLLGSVATARAFLPALTAARGYFLQVASLAALAPAPLMAAYCASKAGVINMIKNVAMDYAKYGIRANCLCPGGVATNISKDALRGLSEAAKERLAKWSGEAVPMARIAEPEELANAALFLCSDESTFVTGTAMVVDGGSIAGHFIPLVE